MSKPTTIQLTFDTDKLADEWWGWYLNGVGENAFSYALSCRGVAVSPTYCRIRGVTEEGITHRLVTDE